MKKASSCNGLKIATDRVHDYTRKTGIVHTEIILPAHAHIMLTMRMINDDGSWGAKQRKKYLLDDNGNKIYDPKKRQSLPVCYLVCYFV